MKLDSFLIAEHMEACDWRAAAGVLASHFNLQIPLPAKITQYPAHFPEKVIDIYHDAVFYRWTASGGFDFFQGYSNLGICSNVYLPDAKRGTRAS